MSKQEKTLIMSVLMTPDMANFSGNVHGGSLLKLLDQVAYSCAAKYCRQYVVTANLDQVSFKDKVKVGELVTFYSRINYVGRSSMEVGVKVMAEDLRSHEKRHTTSCYFTMVAVDDNGKPMMIPPLNIESEAEQLLFSAAQERKKMRYEMTEKNKALHVDLTQEKE